MSPDVLRQLLEARSRQLKDAQHRAYRQRLTVLAAIEKLERGDDVQRVYRDLWDGGIRLPGIQVDTVTEL